MEVPVLPYDFDHAIIQDIVVGPRREATLTISPLVWQNQRGYYIAGVEISFGGIVNFEEVSAFFAMSYHNHTDLAWLRYDKGQQSKPDNLFFELVYERIEAQIIIHCRNMSLTPAELPTGQ